MRIATLTRSDAPEYRELMLEAYARSPDAFTSMADERASEPLAWWETRIAAPDGLSQSFGAFLGSRLVGAVVLEFTTKPKTRHSALVIGMYVRPEARGQGLGKQLIHAAVAAAASKPGIEVLRLTVTEGNEPAIRLYASVGFAAWGVEPHAIRTGSRYKSKVHMAMRLRGDEIVT